MNAASAGQPPHSGRLPGFVGGSVRRLDAGLTVPDAFRGSLASAGAGMRQTVLHTHITCVAILRSKCVLFKGRGAAGAGSRGTGAVGGRSGTLRAMAAF